MKKELFIFILVFSSFVVKSQTSNLVTASEFNRFKINNITLPDLNKTAGKQGAVEAKLGAVISYKVDENESYYYFIFKGLKIDFSTMGKSKPYVESYELNHYGLKFHRFLNLTKVSSTQ